MMNKKNLIKIAIIVIIIMIIVMFFILKSTSLHKETDSINNSEQTGNGTNFEQVYMTSDYFAIKDIIEEFYSNCNKLNLNEKDIDVHKLPISQDELQEYIKNEINSKKELAQEVIYGLFDNSYIDEFGIKKEDIKQKFQLENSVELVIENMYKTKISNNIYIYCTSGLCCDTVTNEGTEFMIMVAVDTENKTYSIFPEEYIKKHNYDKISENTNFNINIDSIEKNGYNTFKKNDKVEDNILTKEYFYNYKNTMLCDKEKAYNMLDKIYREKKFGQLEDYKKYVEENYEKLKKIIVSKYQVVDSKQSKEYVCLDQNNNYYIFSVDSTGNYTLFLDTYTVDLPEFIEEYNSASNQKKMALNINKIISAINQKDYEYVYSKLDETFKQNYYNNQESLETFIKENLFDKNKASFQEYSSEQNLGIYKVRIEKEYQDGEQAPEGKNAEFQNLNIIMKLGQGTDFVMSFSIGE